MSALSAVCQIVSNIFLYPEQDKLNIQKEMSENL